MSVFPSLAIALVPLFATNLREEYIAPRLHLLSPDGPVLLGSPTDHSRFVLPLTSLSELVVRAEFDRGRDGTREIGFEMVHGGTPSLTAVLHGKDEFVVLDPRGGGAPMLVGSAGLPARLSHSGGDDLAFIARRDGQCLRGGTARIGIGEGLATHAMLGTHVLLFGLPAEGHAHQADGFRGWNVVVGGIPALLEASAQRPAVFEIGELEYGEDRSVTLELGDARVDAITFVRAAEAVSSRPARLVAIAQRNVSADSEFDGRAFDRRAVASAEAAAAIRKPFECARSYWFQVGDLTELDGEDRAVTLIFDTGTEAAVTKRKKHEDELGAAGPANRPWTGPDSIVPRERIEVSQAQSEVLRERYRNGEDQALEDVTAAAGIHFVHFEGDAEQLDIRPTMGPGAAWGDVNGDGCLDLVVLQGAGRAGCDPLPDRLYLGSEAGAFRDASEAAGLGRGDAGMGALFVDLDGDADLDLYCANYGLDRLFLNRGDGTFEEATALLPGLDLWSAGVSAADPDGDGDLDLYITSYLDYDLEKMPPAEELGRYQREDPVEMLPFAFPGQRNVFLRNMLAETGELGFADVTEELGLLDVQGRGMQSVFWDFDRDGDEDLYVANDVSFNVLFRNEGDATFKDVSFSTGLDDPRGGMGLAIGDVDRDGDEDLFLTNWQLEANALYLNGVVSSRATKRRRASFHDGTVRSGLGPSGIGKTSWGAELFDLELDGDLDLYVANGYTSPDYESTGICVGQTDQLFVGDGRGRFESASWQAHRTLGAAHASRGAIGADYDRDGDVDLIVTANNGPVRLLRNGAPREGTWIGIRLRQDGRNRFGIGALVTIRTRDGREFSRSLRAGQGYLTGNAPELHFGLGDTDSLESITVRWPDGGTSVHNARPGSWHTLDR